jgi:hypothetical protein
MVLQEYAGLSPILPGPTNPAKQDYMQLTFGWGKVHYEWLVRKTEKFVDVSLHFEDSEVEVNLRRLDQLHELVADLRSMFAHDHISGPFGQKSMQFAVRVPYMGEMPEREEAREAAFQMTRLVGATYPALQAIRNEAR